jgi:hypothetical protein
VLIPPQACRKSVPLEVQGFDPSSLLGNVSPRQVVPPTSTMLAPAFTPVRSFSLNLFDSSKALSFEADVAGTVLFCVSAMIRNPFQ